MTKVEFLKRARKIHGYKYYYVDLVDKIILKDTISMVFGGDLFTQRVSKHLMGKCPEKSIKKKTTESFIKESISIWGDKYDYSITEYNGSLNNVEIIYKGVKYKQRASSHLLGMAPEFRKTDESRRYDKIKIFNEVGYEEIEGFLNKYNINYKKKFKIDKIEFDYYLIDNRTIIEFRGRHHFEPIDNLGGTKTLSDIKKLDLEKEECCEDNYLNLIKIKYDQIDYVYGILWDNLKKFYK